MSEGLLLLLLVVVVAAVVVVIVLGMVIVVVFGDLNRICSLLALQISHILVVVGETVSIETERSSSCHFYRLSAIISAQLLSPLSSPLSTNLERDGEASKGVASLVQALEIHKI